MTKNLAAEIPHRAPWHAQPSVLAADAPAADRDAMLKAVSDSGRIRIGAAFRLASQR